MGARVQYKIRAEIFKKNRWVGGGSFEYHTHYNNYQNPLIFI
jgi:hypothetical protein